MPPAPPHVRRRAGLFASKSLTTEGGTARRAWQTVVSSSLDSCLAKAPEWTPASAAWTACPPSCQRRSRAPLASNPVSQYSPACAYRNVKVADSVVRACQKKKTRTFLPVSELVDVVLGRMASSEGQFSDRYELGQQIGQGAYGTVNIVRRRADDLLLVVKQIPVGRMSDEERRAAEHEADVLRSLDHANICRYFDSVVEVRR